MVPCVGCGKKDMSEPEGRYKMRFIGRPGGKLMKGAPGNYEHGRVYNMPWGHSKFKFWELLEKPPELKVPPMAEGDSVFTEEETVFIPPEVEEWDSTADGDSNWLEVEIEPEPEPTPELESEEELEEAVEVKMPEMDSRTKELSEQYKRQNMFLLDADEGVIVEPDEEEDDEEPDIFMNREEMYEILDKAGVDYSKHSRTDYLAKKVEELDASTKE